MPPEGTEVEAEREPSERAPGVARAVPPRPFVGEMRQLRLMRILVPASAVLVAGRRRRVVIAGNTLDAILLQERDRLVGPGGVAHQVTEVEGVGACELEVGEQLLLQLEVRALLPAGLERADRDGQITIDEVAVDEAALPARLASIAAAPQPAEGRRIYLRADRTLDYGRVMRIMGELNRAGLNRVALVSVGGDEP